MEDGQDAAEAHVEGIGLQDQITPDAGIGNGMKQHREGQTITNITKGLRESLKNVQEYRLLMHEEIEDILKNRSGHDRSKSTQKALSAAGSESM
jgi:hypothetical protein